MLRHFTSNGSWPDSSHKYWCQFYILETNPLENREMIEQSFQEGRKRPCQHVNSLLEIYENPAEIELYLNYCKILYIYISPWIQSFLLSKAVGIFSLGTKANACR